MGVVGDGTTVYLYLFLEKLICTLTFVRIWRGNGHVYRFAKSTQTTVLADLSSRKSVATPSSPKKP